MATGDVTDMLKRLRGNLPPWFPSQGSSPVLDGVLTGIAATLSFVYALTAYAQLQTRILTSTGGFLDLVSYDFFGSRLPRIGGEADPAFDARIIEELVRPRVTRQAMITALEELTGYVPRIVEGWLPSDIGVIDRMYIDVDVANAPGRIGDPGLSAQVFIETVLPLVQTFGNNAMPAIDANLYIDAPPTGYIMDVPSTTQLGPAVVYNLINSIKAEGVTVWVRFIEIPTAVTWDEPGVTWDQPGVAWDKASLPH